MFNLKCSSNNDSSLYLKGPKDCYKSNIVYGEVSQFQFDQLRDNYSQLGTLAGRECKIAIIDEVDAMLIDDSSKISRLSSTAAGLDHFHSIYTFIWQKLLQIKEKFIMFNNKMYLLNGKVSFENGKILFEFGDEQGEIKRIDNLEAYINENENISKIGQRIDQNDIDEFLKKTLNDYITSLVENKVFEVPRNFEEFFKLQRPKWILNAMEAMNYQENVHYVVQDGQIKPVDYFSTGIVQNSTNWSDGLHQFLQLKHNLKMTCESFTTNFLSNIGFIKEYKKVYGLTGTLGSEKSRSILKEVYNVDLINVPQLRQKQYVEYTTIVAENETKWIQEICAAALVETKKNRGILIICETIEQANQIAERLKEKHRPSAIKLYTMNNMNQERQVEKILPCEIIIATNLAGRGTDIQAEAIEHSGGLHVILIFMPNNQRVEDQAFGRTARQGKRGTGQMILNLMNLIGFRNVNPKEVKQGPDSIESRQLVEFQENDLKLINMKDELFGRFSKFLNDEIRFDIRKKSNGLWQKTKSLFIYVMPSVYEQNILTAIEEQWAMFLHGFDDKTILIENAMREYEKLEERLRQEYKNEKVIKNLYYHTVIGNDMIVNKSDPKKALEHFKSALDSNFCGSAYVGVAWSTLSISKNVIKRDLFDNYKKAIEFLSAEMANLNSRQMLLQKIQPGFINSDLDKQLSIKTTILGSYLNSVQKCLNAVKKSLRLIDIVKENDKSIEFYYDLERNKNKKVEGVTWEDNSKYQLIFNNLTSREDTVTIDQAVQNISVALSVIYNIDVNFATDCIYKLKSRFNLTNKIEEIESSSPASYDDITIRLNEISLSRLKSILSPNKEFEELSFELAVSKLKETRSYLNAFGMTSSYNVDAKIVHQDNKKEPLNNIQINELLEIIESKNNKDQSLKYYLNIKEANANDINSFYRTSRANSKFFVQFDGLDYAEADKLLSEITGEYLNIEFIIKKSLLLPIARTNYFNDKNIFKIIICKSKDNIYKIVENDRLISIMENRDADKKNKDEPFRIKIECTQSFGVDLFEKFNDLTFNLTFNKVNYSNFIKYLNKDELEDKSVRFNFENLKKSKAEKFIRVLRQNQFEFCLEFPNLNYKQVIALIEKAHLEQEELQITSVKNLTELFMKSAIPDFELAEFAVKGIEYLIEINEKAFVPWFSVAAVAVLGTLQVVAGGILIATGFGATFGMSLIAEGLSDLLYAYRAYSSRQFNWKDYATQKAISIAISVATAGFSSFKDASKGVATISSEAGKEVVEAGATQVISNGKTAAQQVVKAGTNLKSLAYKYVGTKAGEAIVREGLNNGIQYLSNFSFDIIKPQICENIQEKVKKTFCNESLNQLLRKMYALDALKKSKTLQNRIEKIVADTINPEKSNMNKLWDSIGVPLLKGILSDEKYFGNAFSMGLRIMGTLHGLYAVQLIIDNIYSDLVKKLSQIDRDTLTMTLILHENLKLDKDSARLIATDLKLYDIDEECLLKVDFLGMNNNYTGECEFNNRIEKFKKNKPNQETVSVFLKNYCDEYLRVDVDAFSMVIKSVSDKITNQVISIIQSQMIQPWTTLAVSGVTDALSKRIQHYCLVDNSQNTDAQNEEERSYNELKKKKENNEKLTEKEIEFLNSYEPYNTFGKQINANAKEYTIAYTKSEAAYYAKKKSNSEISNEVKERADDVEFGKRPASMAEISQMADKIKEEYGINVKIVDSPNYERTQEDIESGVEIVYIEKGKQNDNNVEGIGHVIYIDKNGKQIDIKTEPNDCVYGVFSKILETNGVSKSIDDLRSEIAEGIRTNSNYDKVIEAEKWMHERYPHEANTLLFTAGLKHTQVVLENGEINDVLEVEDKDFIELDASLNNTDNKRGKPYDDFFKKAITENGNSNPPLQNKSEYSHHHIIPNNELMTLLKSTQNLNPDERKQILNDYLNKEHIKSVIINNDLINTNPLPGIRVNHGKLIHAAVSWNPHNLVYGPGKTQNGKRHRGKEPDSDTDTEILEKQTENYRTAVDAYNDQPTLNSFGNLPETTPVDFTKYTGNPRVRGKIIGKYYAD